MISGCPWPDCGSQELPIKLRRPPIPLRLTFLSPWRSWASSWKSAKSPSSTWWWIAWRESLPGTRFLSAAFSATPPLSAPDYPGLCKLALALGCPLRAPILREGRTGTEARKRATRRGGPQSVVRDLFDVIDDDLQGGHFGLAQTEAELFAHGIEASGDRRFRH